MFVHDTTGTDHGDGDGPDYGNDTGLDGDAGTGYGFDSDIGIDNGFGSDAGIDNGIGYGVGSAYGDGSGYGNDSDTGFDGGNGDGDDTVSFTQKGLKLMETITIHFTLWFQKGYIADPYFPEREELINIQKLSGMNRARTEAKREQALKEYLRRQEMSQDAYEALEKRALRPWYRDGDQHIIIPSHQFYGCLIEGGKTLSASQRPCDPDNLRHILQLSDWATGKDKEDGIYERLVMPKSGTGQPLSNQRALRKNPFIAQFHATGTISFFLSDIPDAQRITDFVSYCGQRVGVGASRKMGYGRYTIAEHQVT